jgi:hypothetical protein
VDLLGGLAFLFIFVHDRHNVKALSGMLMMWAIGRGILHGACSYLPMSWLCAAERAWNTLTFPLVVKVRLVWWAMRNVLALVSMATVAVCGTTVVGATGAAVRVGDLVAVVAPDPAAGQEATVLLPVAVEDAPLVAPVPATAGQEATVMLPVAVEAAAPAVETKVMQEVEVSTVNAPVEVSTVNAAVVSEEVPVKARTNQASPPNPPSARVQSRSATIQTNYRQGRTVIIFTSKSVGICHSL